MGIIASHVHITSETLELQAGIRLRAPQAAIRSMLK